MTYTEADLDRLSWHDCHIWAVEFRPGSPDDGDWTSDLALDIDFIVEWICGVGEGGAHPERAAMPVAARENTSHEPMRRAVVFGARNAAARREDAR